jgi:serine/threonine protein kinase
MHHPSVISVFDAGQEDDYNYIVMEYVDGVTLQDYVVGDKSLTPNQVVDVIYQCAKGLDYVHRQGVIHRDIKPGNIMLSNDGEVKIMDFSIAHIDIGSTTQEGDVLGSPMYMPPEQVTEEKRLVEQSDIYSLGASMYALLAEKAPYKASNLDSLIYQIANLEPEPLADLNPDIPEHVIEIVSKAMNKIIYDRHDSAQELAEELSRSFGRLRQVGDRIDMQEQWTALRHLNFFKGFNDDQITEVVEASEWNDYEKDEVIVSEGDKETSFFIVIQGGVNVLKKDSVIGKMKQGDCFGEIAFITKAPRGATIIARTDVTLMSVSTSLMEQASLETQLQYYRIFLENLVMRLSQTTEKLVESKK